MPGKNIRPLAGKPLIEYSIRAANEAKFVTRTIVSTDDKMIANISIRSGAEVVMRPSELAGDTAASELALIHVLDTLAENENYQPDLVVFLQCTSPLTLPEDIDGIISELLTNDADSALSAAPFHHFLWKSTEEGSAVGINHDFRARLMRQNLDQEYLENGAIYVFKTPEFLINRYRFFGKIHLYSMPVERCLEIDEIQDFRLAELILGE